MNYEKAYKELVGKIEKAYLYAQTDSTKAVLEEIRPEFAESEDERIKEDLIQWINEFPDTIWRGHYKKDVIAWLESNGEQYNNEDLNILQRFSFYSYKDEPNILYLSGLYVNEKCRNKGIGTKILEVADEVAKSLNCHAIRLKTKIGSNAERLYRRNQYHTLKREGNQVWLEKQGELKETLCDKCKKAQPSHSCQDITALGRCAIEKQGEQRSKLVDFDYNAKDSDLQEVTYFIPKGFHAEMDGNKVVIKRGEKKTADNIEPKFHEGDWVVDNCNNLWKIVGIMNGFYILEDGDEGGSRPTIEWVDKTFHLWTIEDAKKGDVLASKNGGTILIFRNLDNNIGFSSYYNTAGMGELGWSNNRFIPATKEQCDLLFSKMKEEGYEWDEVNKKLI